MSKLPGGGHRWYGHGQRCQVPLLALHDPSQGHQHYVRRCPGHSVITENAGRGNIFLVSEYSQVYYSSQLCRVFIYMFIHLLMY